MPAQLSSASVQSRRSSQRLDVGRRTTALAVAIHVERLDRVVHAEIFMQEFFRRHVLMSESHHAVPHGHGFLAVGHVGLEKRCLPSLEVGNVVDAPRQDLDVGNDTDFLSGTCRFLAKSRWRAKPRQAGNGKQQRYGFVGHYGCILILVCIQSEHSASSAKSLFLFQQVLHQIGKVSLGNSSRERGRHQREIGCLS